MIHRYFFTKNVNNKITVVRCKCKNRNNKCSKKWWTPIKTYNNESFRIMSRGAVLWHYLIIPDHSADERTRANKHNIFTHIRTDAHTHAYTHTYICTYILSNCFIDYTHCYSSHNIICIIYTLRSPKLNIVQMFVTKE